MVTKADHTLCHRGNTKLKCTLIWASPPVGSPGGWLQCQAVLSPGSTGEAGSSPASCLQVQSGVQLYGPPWRACWPPAATC